MAVSLQPFGLLLLLCIFVHQALSIPQFHRPSTLELPSAEDEGKIWVVLVSGSKGWWDYEDQASVCRAWHMFVDNGVNPNNIITMMYDDIANNTNNPYPGKIFNHPNGSDVYEGVRIDYKGDDVTPANFMAVLLGNETATNGKPVLKSTKNDKVFVHYTDHGGSGVVAFPHSILTVKSLAETLEGIHEREMYKELTFYLSACQSGSMFLDKLPENIYAVTSTNAKEPGLRCFCDTKLIPGVCIGHVFSVVWMEDTEQGDLNERTLADQFEILKNITLHPSSVDPDPRIWGSHVQAFGDLNIQKEFLSEFMGNGKAPSNSSSKNVETSFSDLDVYPSGDIRLLMLAQEQENGMEMQILLKNRQYLEEQMNELMRKVLQKEDSTIQGRALTISANAISAKGITQLECHHQVMHAFNDHCFNFGTNPYALKYSYMLTNLCELGIDEGRIKATMLEHCANLDTDKLEIV